MHPSLLPNVEAQLLGVLLNHPAAVPATEGAFALPPICFTDGRNLAIYNAAQALHAADTPVEVLTVLGELQTAGTLTQAGGFDYVSNLAVAPGRLANIRTYIGELKTAGRARQRVKVGQRLASADFHEDADELADAAARALMDPALRADADPALTGAGLAELAAQTYDEAAALAASGRRFVGLDCGFDTLNDKLNGLCPGEFTVLAARPSIGKTTLAQQIALEAALRENAPVAFFSLEMTKAQVAGRFACLLGNIDPEAHRKGRLSPADHKRYVTALNTLASLPITVYTADRDSAAIDARVRSLKAAPPALVVVDHLHRLAERGSDSDHEKLGTAAHRLANLAVEQSTHVLLLSQLNRQCEDRPDKRPAIADLRGSGSIEEHAVNAILIYRPGHYEELRRQASDPDALQCEVFLLCEKTRHAPVGSVPISWDAHLAKFSAAAPTYGPPVADYDSEAIERFN